MGQLQPFVPMAQGFDFHFGMYSNLDPVETVYFGEAGVPILRNGKVVKRPADPAELTKLYTDEAMAFVERNKERPFFLYLPHTMLHVPLGVRPQFQGSSKWGEYGDAIQELDHEVGRFMDHLVKLGIDERTIVVYASDNGRGPGRNPQQPLIGRKLTTWECGIRVPAIIRAPGRGVRKGHACKEVVHALDWLPTLATAAGIRIPVEHPVIDGRDLWPMMTGESEGIPAPSANASLNADVPLRRRWEQGLEWQEYFNRDDYLNAFFYHGSQGALSAVRSGNYKMNLHPTLAVYDLEKDPKESKPIRQRALLRKLRGMAVMFQEEMSRDARKAGEVEGSFGAMPTQTEPDWKALPPTKLSPEINQAIEAHPDLVYARYGERELQLDLFRPKKRTAALPAIVCIHGGGWSKGSRLNHGHIARALASRGYVTVSISYRLSGEAPFPAQIHDAKAAVRWLRANADKWGINPEAIGATGLSAGGHLTALLATSAGVAALEGTGGHAAFSSRIQAAAPMGAQSDLETERIRLRSLDPKITIFRQFLGGSQTEVPETYRLASPRHHLSKDDPPLLFLTGELDDPSTRAKDLRKEYETLGIAASHHVIADAPHPFLVKQPFFDTAVDRLERFFAQHLR